MWRSGRATGGGIVVAEVVEVEFWKSGESEVVVEGRNWKSARRRSAHLLAEKLVGTLLARPITALSLGGLLPPADN